MKDTLEPGIKYEHTFVLTDQKMVPALYPESAEFQQMPAVFATGFMVGFLEWACLNSVISHLDWPKEQTVGTHVDVSHLAATPSGFTVTAKVELIEVDGRRLLFAVEGYDEVDLISRGTHERFIIDRDRFDSALEKKRNRGTRME
ncbi:MAG: thioesterase [Gammaproteobacteria bacterium]|nr:thioesterase [Gammaproteobacteria bacterium]